MKTKLTKMELIPVLLSVVNLIVSVMFIRRLPEVVPTHFGMDWVCDGVGSPWTGFFLPLLPVIVAVTAPPINHRTQKKEQGRHVTQIVILMICMYFMVMSWLMLLSMGSGAQLGEKVEIQNFGWMISFCIAIMYIGMGNYMPVMPQSRTLGIRIRYTLENEACWKLTHRMAGKLWVMTGIVQLLLSLLAMLLHAEQLLVFILVFAVLTVNIVIPVVYAYQHKDAA